MRLDSQDTPAEALNKLSEGDSAALYILLTLIANADRIDPDLKDMAAVAPVMWLDNLEIYGENINKLYADVCHNNVIEMHSLLRAQQLGICTPEFVQKCVAEPKTSYVNFEKVIRLIKQQVKGYMYESMDGH